MSFVDVDVIAEVERLSQENDELSWEIQVAKERVDALDLEYHNLGDYRNNSLAILMIKDIFVVVFGFVILLVISLVLSMIGFAPVIGFLWVIVLLGLAFEYFKLILVAIIFMAIATFLLNREPTEVIVGFNVMILLATFLIFRMSVIYKNKQIINYLDELNHLYNQNTEYILHLIYQPLSNHIQSAGLVDMNSIQENGFSFVETEYLAKYLIDEVKRENLKVSTLPQSDTVLFRSTKQPPIMQTNTTHLQID